MRLLVAGARGLLGAAIVREFTPEADVRAFARAELDLTDAAAVHRAVDAVRPDAIVNCAAFNDVDGAEDRAADALAVNAFGVLTLAVAAQRHGCALVHYSTDFVFDGDASRPYTEDDPPNPRSVYGVSKLLGEWFADDCPRAYVLRVESLFGEPAPGVAPRGSVHAIVARIRAGEAVPVFVDRIVSPTYTVDVARATRRLLETAAPAGLYHCVSGGSGTWAAVAEEVGRVLGRSPMLRPLTLEEVGLRAARPRYCALSNAKLASLGIVLPEWGDALRRYLSVP